MNTTTTHTDEGTTTMPATEITVLHLGTTDANGCAYHVHAAGCADLNKYGRSQFPNATTDTRTASSERDVVVGLYDPECFDYDPDTEWDDYAIDVKFYPCCHLAH